MAGNRVYSGRIPLLFPITPMSEDQLSTDIAALLKTINHAEEDVRHDAREYLADYRSEALARPVKERVEVLRALLRTKLRDLLASARRERRIQED